MSESRQNARIMGQIRRTKNAIVTVPTTSERTDRNFRRILAKTYERVSWAYPVVQGITALLLHLSKSYRRDILLGEDFDQENYGHAKKATKAWRELVEMMRERGEFLKRHKIGDRHLDAFLESLPEDKDFVQQALADLLAQKPSILPVHRSPLAAKDDEAGAA